MRTRRSTKSERNRLSWGTLGAIVLFEASLVASVLAAVATVQSGEWMFLLTLSTYSVLLLAFEITALRRMSRRLREIRPRDRSLAHHYDHLALWCKKPLKCARCTGWYIGFAAYLSNIGGVISGAWSPVWFPDHLGVSGSLIGGTVLLSLTPVHGSAGRLLGTPKTHWSENPILSVLMGFAFALGMALVGEGVVYLLQK